MISADEPGSQPRPERGLASSAQKLLHCCKPPQEKAMHELSIPADLVDRVTTRTGRAHPFDVIEPAKTAFVVVDMQNYFMKPGFQGEVPKARAIVPAVNRLAAAVRELGGHVVWVKNATNDTRESWSVFHDWLHTPQRRDRRYATMDLAHEGHALWAELDAKPEDAQIVKKRFSAFLPGSSDIVAICADAGSTPCSSAAPPPMSAARARRATP
jgi:ureidoacrylate peracid hydrolase